MKEVLRGEGHIHFRKGIPYFKGSFPVDDNDIQKKGRLPAYILRREDLDVIMEAGLLLLLGNKQKMSGALFTQFPDAINHIENKGRKNQKATSLYLDRHLYAIDAEKSIWVRYQSVEEAEREGEFR